MQCRHFRRTVPTRSSSLSGRALASLLSAAPVVETIHRGAFTQPTVPSESDDCQLSSTARYWSSNACKPVLSSIKHRYWTDDWILERPMATACSRLLIAWVITRSPHELTAQVTRRIAEQLPAETKAAWASKDKSALTKMRRRTSSKKMLQSANVDQQTQMLTDLREAIAEGRRGIRVDRIRAALHRCRTNSYFPKPEYQKAGRLLQVIAIDSDADCAIGEEGGVIGFSSLRQTSWTSPGPVSQCIQGQSPYILLRVDPRSLVSNVREWSARSDCRPGSENLVLRISAPTPVQGRRWQTRRSPRHLHLRQTIRARRVNPLCQARSQHRWKARSCFLEHHHGRHMGNTN